MQSSIRDCLTTTTKRHCAPAPRAGDRSTKKRLQSIRRAVEAALQSAVAQGEVQE
jgi:hypothetical protein